MKVASHGNAAIAQHQRNGVGIRIDLNRSIAIRTLIKQGID
jgi:hypothetical protein